MTHERFINLLRFAHIVGIYTLGDLAKYKERKSIGTSKDLYTSLYYDALEAKRNAPKRDKLQAKAS